MRFALAALLSVASTTKYTYAIPSSPSVVNTSAFVVPATTTETIYNTNLVAGTSVRTNTSLLSAASPVGRIMADTKYPGTAVERMMNARKRVQELAATPGALDGSWEDVRRKILWAGGLRDLPDARPGQGYTGHSFNDFNHVDLTCMVDNVSDNENDGAVSGIAIGNRLGNGIRIASLPELGPGGSWSTCALGCSKEPPQDVAHIQFRARIAFKLVWVPSMTFDQFVLVDDDGKLLAKGKPGGPLPPLRERKMNYNIVEGSKYAREADLLARNIATE